jgi:hypothetical protein
MSNPPVLTARFRKLDSALRVDYTVLNPGPDALYLTNHACRVGPSGPVPDRNETFVFVEERVVHLTKRIPPPPAAFHNRIPHFVVPLPAGEEFSETLVLHLPLRPRIPYRKVELSGDTVLATHVYLSIGFKVGSALLEAVPVERSGREVFVLRSTLAKGQPPPPGLAPTAEQFLLSPRVELEVPVLGGTPLGP